MIEVTVDAGSVDAGFSELEEQQIPFALSKAINATGLQFQQIQVAHDASIFTQRRADWQAKSIKVTHFSTKRENWMDIEVMPPGADGASRADILAKFESDTTKLPFKGQHVAIPTSQIKRTKRDIVADSMRISHLNLHPDGNRIIGDQRTFLIKLANGNSLILQRVGHGGKSTTASVWLLVPLVHITPDLEFQSNAEAVVNSAWVPNFEQAFTDAMATAK